MTGSISARQLALGHFLLAKRLYKKTSLVRPSALKHLENQLNKHQLDSSPAHMGAFTAYWLNSQRPFSSGNMTSAIVLGLAVAGVKATDQKIKTMAIKLKRGAGVKEIETVISGG